MFDYKEGVFLDEKKPERITRLGKSFVLAEQDLKGIRDEFEE